MHGRSVRRWVVRCRVWQQARARQNRQAVTGPCGRHLPSAWCLYDVSGVMFAYKQRARQQKIGIHYEQPRLRAALRRGACMGKVTACVNSKKKKKKIVSLNVSARMPAVSGKCTLPTA